MRQVVVLIGGTGVIGSAVTSIARERGLDLVCLSLDAHRSDNSFRNIQLDLNAIQPKILADLLDEGVRNQPVALTLDIFGLDEKKAAAVANFAAERNSPLALISSCLLYDQDGTVPVDESCRLVTPGPDCHAYIGDKLAIETFWQGREDVEWRIFRCQHILGVGSILGCIPNHNRDPQLIARLRRGEPLELTRSGEVSLSWIHPEDLASAILTLCADPRSSRCAINLTHPEPVRARRYYDAIARALGVPCPKVMNFEPNPQDFWSLTARDNVFFSRHDFYRSVTFRHDLESGIHDALSIPESELTHRGRFLRARLLGREQR